MFLENILEGFPRFCRMESHVSEDSTGDHRMQGLMLNLRLKIVVEGFDQPKSATSELEKSIAWNHELNRILP